MVFLVQVDVEGHNLSVFAPERHHQQGVHGLLPADQAFVGQLGQYGPEVDGKGSLGPDEIHFAQELDRPDQVVDIGADIVGDGSEDAHDLAALGVTQFANLVVHFNNFGRLDIGSFSGGRLIVYDALELALIGRQDRDDRASVADSHRGIVVDQAIVLCLLQDLLQPSRNTRLKRKHLPADAAQLGRGIVFDLARFIQYGVNPFADIWINLDA